jgi:hypothetical protein
MEERDFFDERPEQRTHTLTCPHCGQPGEYQIGWLVRRKKNQLRGNADERDRARFAKAQSYMVRTDDVLACKNIRCRKRFDVAGIQSVAFLQSICRWSRCLDSQPAVAIPQRSGRIWFSSAGTAVRATGL